MTSGQAAAVPGPRLLGPAQAWGLGALAALLLWYVGRYGDSTTYFFHFDDFWLLRYGNAVTGPLDIFRPGPVGFVLYRPFSQVGYFALLERLFGHDPAPYHAVQLLAHAVNAFLVYGLSAAVLRSRPLGLGAALVYAAQPGHAIAVYWLALYSMTGTATWYLACLWVWVARGRSLEPGVPRETRMTTSRWSAAFALFIGALLCGEHAVSLPLALAAASVLVVGEPWRVALRSLAPFLAVAALYAAAKVLYMRLLLEYHLPDPMLRAIVHTEYQPRVDPLTSLRLLGFYVGCAFGWLYDSAATAESWYVVGSLSLVVATLCAWWARRHEAGRPVLFGVLLFAVALAPVLLLPRHAYSYYVGIAGAGFALALVALARAPSRWGRGLAPVAVVVTLLGEVLVGEDRARASGEFAFFHRFQRAALSWLDATTRMAERNPDVREMVVPHTGITYGVFGDGRVHKLLTGGTYGVRLSRNLSAEKPAPGRIILDRPSGWHRGTSYPGSRTTWDWLRWRDPWASE